MVPPLWGCREHPDNFGVADRVHSMRDADLCGILGHAVGHLVGSLGTRNFPANPNFSVRTIFRPSAWSTLQPPRSAQFTLPGGLAGGGCARSSARWHRIDMRERRARGRFARWRRCARLCAPGRAHWAGAQRAEPLALGPPIGSSGGRLMCKPLMLRELCEVGQRFTYSVPAFTTAAPVGGDLAINGLLGLDLNERLNAATGRQAALAHLTEFSQHQRLAHHAAPAGSFPDLADGR